MAEIGRELGFDLTLGTRGGNRGRFSRDLENHKGAAKVARLKEVLPASYFENGKLRHCHGYTDSRADLPMLGLCESATVVNPSPARRARGEIRLGNRAPGAAVEDRASDFALRVLALLTGLGRIRRSHSSTWKKSRMTSR